MNVSRIECNSKVKQLNHKNMETKGKAPLPYRDDGRAFIGEGKGAPEAVIKPETQKEMLNQELADAEKRRTYEQLENGFVTYADSKKMEVRENGEGFVSLPQTLIGNFGAIGRYGKLRDMESTFPLVPVREAVQKKLDQIDRAIKSTKKSLQLVVAYGYRSLEIQKKYFEEQEKKYREENGLDETEDINEIIHRKVAVPEVAGHPSGGAVDVFIDDTENLLPLDFGTPIFTLNSKDTYALSPYISEEAKKNRELLRKTMKSEGFAPYDGEWWHFSFGDKEWATYYKEQRAFYDQKKQEEVLISLKV